MLQEDNVGKHVMGPKTLFFLMVAWIVLQSCAGKFETKPALTDVCRTAWLEAANINPAQLPNSDSATGFHVLVWNIHDRLLGDSNISKGGHTEEEVVCIGDLAKRFDLVLFQEAFVRPAQIARYTKHEWASHPIFQEGGGGDWWPLRIFCEICLTPGLLMLAKEKPEFVHAEPYEDFAGWNTKENKADDFFSKGFQLVKFKDYWVLNSHMDSGRGQDSIDARALQFKQITAAFKRFVPKEARLLVGMDSNLRPEKEAQDGAVLKKFLETNGLTVVRHSGPDLIASRNMTTKNPQSLPLKDVLSDHNALSVVIQSYP